jgi:hypothetical protein
LKVETVLKTKKPMGVSGETIGTAMSATAVKVKRVIEAFGVVWLADMMQGGLYFDLDIFHFLRVVIDFHERGGIRGGQKGIIHSTPLKIKSPTRRQREPHDPRGIFGIAGCFVAF